MQKPHFSDLGQEIYNLFARNYQRDSSSISQMLLTMTFSFFFRMLALFNRLNS